MNNPRKPQPEQTEKSELFRALNLAERLMAPRADGGTEALPIAAKPSAGKTLRYWLWRAGGRKVARGDATQVAENYERELTRQRARIAELERLTGQLQQSHAAEMAMLKSKMAGRRPATPDEVERARLAESKVEMLKEALEITRARAGASPATADHRFREAKHAFARLFHPDQGGRNDPERERIFLDFWPVLERIEREGG